MQLQQQNKTDFQCTIVPTHACLGRRRLATTASSIPTRPKGDKADVCIYREAHFRRQVRR